MSTIWVPLPRNTWTEISDIPSTIQSIGNRGFKFIEADTAPTNLNGPYRTASPGREYVTEEKTFAYPGSFSNGLVAVTDGRNARDVFIQDQTTPPFDLYFALVQGSPTTLTADTTIDDFTIEVASVANIVAGTYLGLFSGESGENRFYFGTVLDVTDLVVTLDTPLDFAFLTGDVVQSTTRNMNVLGTQAVPVTFSIRGSGGGLELIIDITRILFAMITDSAADLSKFGDLPALTNGIVLRRDDGFTTNITNIKTNRDLLNLAYDLQIFGSLNPAQGVDGLACRYTFAGQDKHGVAVRLESGDSLDIIIQDDLTGLTDFKVIAAGHIVEC